MAAQSAFKQLFGAGGGGAGILGGIGRFLFGGMPSFDGGGWTGGGARTGGLDGKGGFLAMMHPREQVIDTTRGAGGLSVSIGFDASAGSLTAFVRDQAGRVVAQAAPAIVGQSVSATQDALRTRPPGWSRRA
jgi:hypothetical protein